MPVKRVLPKWKKKIVKDNGWNHGDLEHFLEGQQGKPFNRKEIEHQLFWFHGQEPEARRVRVERWRESAFSSKLKFGAFELEANRLKKRVPQILLKEGNIKTSKSKLEKFHSVLSARNGVPQRFEDVAQVIRKLGRDNLLEGKEILITSDPFIDETRLSAGRMATRLSGLGSHEANWDLLNYNCRIFFDPKSFSRPPVGQGSFPHWGTIKATEGKTYCLAIQIFDPNPKKLLEFAKAMAKLRANDPIPIIDLYGKVFYP